jgi:hypothetical protein
MSIPSALDALRSLVDPDDRSHEARRSSERLLQRILILSDYAWERRIDQQAVERWLDNFDGRSGLALEVERLHALYLLSQFLYFGLREIRVLLHALYRDLFLIPLIQEIRQKNGNTRDELVIRRELEIAMDRTRFMGVGNPSESGVHLLYYFRQENGLQKQNFMDTAQIFSLSGGTRCITDPTVERYIFLDDVCGSGQTACRYSKNFLTELRVAKPDAQIAYYSIFATTKGINNVRENTVFGANAKAIFELDESYRCVSDGSRYFKIRPPQIEDTHLSKVALSYGELLAPGNAGGFDDGQLLLGFSHNIPDNTLPIIWRDPTNGSPIPWTAALRRYMKV